MSDGFYEVDEQDTVVTDGHGDAAFSVDVADNQGDAYHADGGYDSYGNGYVEFDGVDGQGDAVHGVQVTDGYGNTYTEVDAVDGDGNAVVYQEYDGYVAN